MLLNIFKQNHIRTAFVQLNTRKCNACWKCINKCPSKAIGKIDLPWHKHALILKADKCIGCMKCINICEFGAYK